MKNEIFGEQTHLKFYQDSPAPAHFRDLHKQTREKKMADAIKLVFQLILLKPLKLLYLHSPEIFGVGGWSGRAPEAICYEMSPSSRVNYWTSSPESLEECHRMIEQRFDSFSITVFGVLYFLFLFSFCFQMYNGCWKRAFSRRYSSSNMQPVVYYERRSSSSRALPHLRHLSVDTRIVDFPTKQRKRSPKIYFD